MDKGQLDCGQTAGQASPPMGPRGAIWPPRTYNSLLGTILLFFSFLRASGQEAFNCSSGEVYLNATIDRTYIVTPNYGTGEYPGNMDCHFLLMAPPSFKIMVFLEIVQFEAQLFDECLDFVAISKDNLQLKADTIAKFCGRVENRQVSSTDNQLKISLFSDSLIQDKGARLFFQAIPPNECEPNWYRRGYSCIKLVEDEDGADFIEAQFQCAQQQSNLLSITTDTEYNQTMAWLSNASGSPWIGYTDSGTEGTIKGITELGGKLWPIPQPPINGNDDSRDCIYLDLPNTHWQEGELPYRIGDCRTKQSFICEKNMDGSTHPVTPPIEKIKSGVKKGNFDLANLLFLLIVLVLLVICCCICYTTCFRKTNTVHPVTQQTVRQSDGVATTAQPPTIATTTRVAPVQHDRSFSPTATAPLATTVAPARTNNVRATAPPPTRDPVPIILPITVEQESKLHHSPPLPRSAVTVVNEQETETAILPSREKTEEQPEARPRTLPPLQLSSTSPYQTMNTREDSFMRARIAQEMFERPKMELLDNVSAISLDEFWSNIKKKQHQS